MDNISPKMIKIVLYISIIFAILGGFLASKFFNVPVAIGAFFGVILGFFFPWVIALLAYTFYAISNPTLAFKDEINKPKKQ